MKQSETSLPAMKPIKGRIVNKLTDYEVTQVGLESSLLAARRLTINNVKETTAILARYRNRSIHRILSQNSLLFAWESIKVAKEFVKINPKKRVKAILISQNNGTVS